ncbi:MAG: hypothetical protein IJB55_01225, partial [Firmicutes bacterium]|nr:hypothetical protein [Bacillota bacterium]
MENNIFSAVADGDVFFAAIQVQFTIFNTAFGAGRMNGTISLRSSFAGAESDAGFRMSFGHTTLRAGFCNRLSRCFILNAALQMAAAQRATIGTNVKKLINSRSLTLGRGFAIGRILTFGRGFALGRILTFGRGLVLGRSLALGRSLTLGRGLALGRSFALSGGLALGRSLALSGGLTLSG